MSGDSVVSTMLHLAVSLLDLLSPSRYHVLHCQTFSLPPRLLKYDVHLAVIVCMTQHLSIPPHLPSRTSRRRRRRRGNRRRRRSRSRGRGWQSQAQQQRQG